MSRFPAFKRANRLSFFLFEFVVFQRLAVRRVLQLLKVSYEGKHL